MQAEDNFCKKKIDLASCKKQTLKDFELINGMIYIKKLGRKRPVISNSMTEDILHACHCEPSSGHQGFKKTYDRIKTRFWWKKMKKHVLNWTYGCTVCKQCKHRTTRMPGLLQPISPPEQPFQWFSFDLSGPFPSSEGQVHIAVAVCYATRYVFAKGIPTAKATDIIEFLREEIICHVRVMQVLLTDRASAFYSEEMKAFLQEYGIQHKATTFKHSATNGLVERTHQTIVTTLRAFVDNDQIDWNKYLSSTVFSLNTSTSASTEYTPFYLNFGFEARLAIENKVGTRGTEESREEALKDLWDQRGKANKDIIKAQGKMKDRVDKGRRDVQYNPGDKVAIYMPFRKIGRNFKLDQHYRDGYIIEEKINDLLYKVIGPNGKSKVVNIQKLRYLP